MVTGTALRRVAAAVLLVLGSIGVVVASTGWWLERSFLDTARFTATANRLLDREEIQTELTELLVNRLSMQAGTDLQIAQPFLAAIVSQVVDSDPFRQVFDTALSTAHRVLVDRDTGDIVLDLTSAYEQIRGPLEQVAPNLAAELPNKRQLYVVLLQRSQLTALWDIMDSVRRVVVILTVVAVAFVASGIALAVDRWRAVARAGWVIVGSVLVLLFALLVGRWVLVAQTDDGTLADAIGAAYRVLVRPLVIQSVLVAILAAIIALAARYTARVGIHAWRGAAVDSWHWVTGVVPGAEGVTGLRLPAPRTDHRAVRVLRALGLLAIGLFAVLMPDTVTDIVAVLIGLGVLYLALIEGVAAWRAPSERVTSARVRREQSAQ